MHHDGLDGPRIGQFEEILDCLTAIRRALQLWRDGAERE
jgi:hypothetical protein